MVLEQDSSVLGYPGETSRAIDADHHGICKFESPMDPNYISVRNILKSLVSKIISKSKPSKAQATDRTQSHDLKAFLALTDMPGIDYIFFRDQWRQGTSEWILHDQTYLNWLQAQGPSLRILWLNGGAATGKSVLSSFIVNNLVEQGASCQYFFFRFSDRRKRSLSLCLRTIAYQLAQSIPGFMERALELADERMDMETADPRTIWERLFKSILLSMEISEPLYWVIDGLDESDDPRALVRLLSDVASSAVPLRILFTGRNTFDLAAVFHRIPTALDPDMISIEGHVDDLRCYIQQELTVFGSASFRESIVQRILEGAQNNFLVGHHLDILPPGNTDSSLGSGSDLPSRRSTCAAIERPTLSSHLNSCLLEWHHCTTAWHQKLRIIHLQ